MADTCKRGHRDWYIRSDTGRRSCRTCTTIAKAKRRAGLAPAALPPCPYWRAFCASINARIEAVRIAEDMDRARIVARRGWRAVA